MKKTIALLLLIASTVILFSCSSTDKQKEYFDFSEKNKTNTSNNNVPETSENFVPNGYTVNFVTYTSETISPKKNVTTISELPTPKKQYAKFDGWYLDNQYKYKAVTPLSITKDITLYAKWTTEYTLYFETCGGTAVSSIKTSGAVQNAPTTTKENHIFDGWYYDSSYKNKATFPMVISTETVLYAKWIKTSYTRTVKDTKIKDWDPYYSQSTYNITPTDLNLELLKEKGYNVNITVYYTVYYKKDYDALLDIGYLGAPKYEVYLRGSNGTVYSEEDIKTNKNETQKTISYTYDIDNLKNVSLIFSTNNIQNIIYFENITIKYTCIK